MYVSIEYCISFIIIFFDTEKDFNVFLSIGYFFPSHLHWIDFADVWDRFGDESKIKGWKFYTETFSGLDYDLLLWMGPTIVKGKEMKVKKKRKWKDC